VDCLGVSCFYACVAGFCFLCVWLGFVFFVLTLAFLGGCSALGVGCVRVCGICGCVLLPLCVAGLLHWVKVNSTTLLCGLFWIQVIVGLELGLV